MTQNNGKKIIAITGGIGSGKTEVSHILKRAGYKVVSCDEITAGLYKSRKIKKSLAEIFPLAVSGKIIIKVDKKKIAEQTFSDGGKRARLNALLHPVIISNAVKKAKRGGGRLAFVEIPLLFETDSARFFDGVIVVKRDIKERIKAVTVRSALTEEEVLKRINSQFDYDGADLSDYITVENDGDICKLESETLKAVKKI